MKESPLTTPVDLFIFAGETSGDSHGSGVVREMLLQNPSLIIEGVAGPKMRNQGVKAFIKMEEFQVMGFTDVLLNFPSLYEKFYRVLNYILQINPKGIFLIDYPGFNLRLAKALRKKGYKGKIIHYICPSVWAWGKNRIQILAKNVDELLVIYPFEKDFFKGTTLPVTYIGNPSYEAIQRHVFHNDWRETVGLPEETPHLIALFPGSRKREIERNLQMQLDVMEKIRQKLPTAYFALSITSPKLQAIITPYLCNFKGKIVLVPSQYNFELMKESTTAIAKSGTITLELALLKRPTTVIYGLTPFNRFVAKYLIRLNLPHYCIVNILKNERLFPELIEDGFNVDTLTEETLRLETDQNLRSKVIEGCEQIIKLLGDSNASRRAAERIMDLCDIK